MFIEVGHCNGITLIRVSDIKKVELFKRSVGETKREMISVTIYREHESDTDTHLQSKQYSGHPRYEWSYEWFGGHDTFIKMLKNALQGKDITLFKDILEPEEAKP